MNKINLLLVANPAPSHIGDHFKQAAEDLRIDCFLCDLRQAFAAPLYVTKLNWWFCQHRPPRMRQFSNEIISACKKFQPHFLLSVGIAPIETSALTVINSLGIKKLNFLTDNPFNKAHCAARFIKNLPLYDHVFSPRQSNIENLRQAGCQRVTYLPFAYSPYRHYEESPDSSEEYLKLESDILFFGGADKDRIPYILALIKAGFKIGLYGGYWEKFKQTRRFVRGHLDYSGLRKAVTCAKVVLCLVRRANCDGHSMRTFEIPAIGACMLTEDTKEHREIFGEEWQSVAYFKNMGDMIEKARFLLNNNEERKRLATAAKKLILSNKHTYKDRLDFIIKN